MGLQGKSAARAQLPGASVSRGARKISRVAGRGASRSVPAHPRAMGGCGSRSCGEDVEGAQEREVRRTAERWDGARGGSKPSGTFRAVGGVACEDGLHLPGKVQDKRLCLPSVEGELQRVGSQRRARHAEWAGRAERRAGARRPGEGRRSYHRDAEHEMRLIGHVTVIKRTL